MSVEDFKILLAKLPENCGKVDLHGYGEPLLDDTLGEKVQLAKHKWPNARLRIITTLGVANGAEKVAELARLGLNSVEISYYGDDEEAYRKAHGVNAYKLATTNIEQLRNLQPNGLEIIVRSLDGADQQEVCEEHQQENAITKGKLHNFGSGRNFNRAPKGTCSVVAGLRSRILQVTWQLDVIPCCFDYNAEIKLGNLRVQSLEEIFSSETYSSFIEAHISGNIRNVSPCDTCEKCLLP